MKTTSWLSLVILVIALAWCPTGVTAHAATTPVADFSATPTTWNAPANVAFTDRSSSDVTSWAWNFGDGTQSEEKDPVHQYDDPGIYTVSLTVTSPGGTASKVKSGYITVEEYLPVGDEYLVSIDAAAHKKFGLFYPATYKFKIPSGAQGLKAQYRYWEGTWRTLTEKKSTDTFNGVDAVRFDYTAGVAYVSVRFDRSSENIYLRIIDGSGKPVAITFDSIPKYYDARQAAVTITLDDWALYSDADFETAIAYLAAGKLFYSVGFITNDVPWSSVQEVISQNGENIEMSSHSVHHPCSAANFQSYGYQAEVIGSRDAIRNNLTFYGNPYVPAFLEPCGYTDNTLAYWVTAGDYLVVRSASGYFPAGSQFVAWDANQGRYGRAGYVLGTSGYSATDNKLVTDGNALFDSVLSQGLIYHLADHPHDKHWFDNSPLVQHLNYIKGRTNIWYVPFGQLYLYHFLQEQRGNLTVKHLTNTAVVANFSAAPLAGSPPLRVSFTDTSTGEITGWRWDFGDSGTSTEQNPTHVYNAVGNYSVSLTVTGAAGSNTRTATRYITVNTSGPTVAITAPLNGEAYNAPASIAIAATATAGSGATVTKVEFYAGSTPVGVSSSVPYGVTWSNAAAGSYVLTAKVTDSLGATATSSGVTVSVRDTTLPSPWISQDIGSVGLAGSAGYLEGTFTVKAAGSDIWGTADSFRFVYQRLIGDGQIVARVASLQNTNTYAKGGVMIRETLTPGSIHAMVDLTPGSGAEFSRRTSTGGSTSVTSMASVAAPYWVKLVRSGNTFTASVSKDGVAWVQVGSSSIAMPSSAYVGLVDTSHNNSTLCTAVFDGVTVTSGQVVAPTASITAPVNGATFPAPATVQLTATAAAGTGATVNRVDFYAGTALIGTANTAPYSVTWSNVAAGSYSLTAKVTDSLGQTATSQSVAVTVTAPASPTVSITAPVNGASYTQPANIQISATASPGSGATVARVDFYAGNVLVGTARTTPYTVTWSNVTAGQYSLTATVTDSLGAMATSSPVTVTVTAGGLPAPWLTQDIGNVGVAGSASYLNDTFTIKGSGSDIWGTSDSFRFVYKPLNGDGHIVARVVSLTNTNNWAKAGVMMRQSLSANSAHAMVDVTPVNGAEFSRRTRTGGSTSTTSRSGVAAPYWVKLTRSGNSFSGSISSDGITWVQVGSSTITMTSSVYVGLIVTSHSNHTLNTATIDHVQ